MVKKDKDPQRSPKHHMAKSIEGAFDGPIAGPDEILDGDPGTLYADGFEDARIGLGQHFNNVLAIYDYDRCVDILMQRDGMDFEQAEEWMSYNVVGAYVGDHTPVFMTLKNRERD